MVNYNKMAKNKKPESEVVETVDAVENVGDFERVEEIAQPKTKIGVVVNCDRLYVRSAPDADANPVKDIACGTELMIDDPESTDEFYKVFTAAGLEGFCMKKFIKIQP